MGSAGLLTSELDWLSTSLDRDLITETLATLVPSPATPDQGWDEPVADRSDDTGPGLFARLMSVVRTGARAA